LRRPPNNRAVNLLRRVASIFGFGRQTRPRLFDQTFSPVEHPLRPELDQRYLDMRTAMASGSAAPIAALLTTHFASVDISGNETTADGMIAAVLKLDIDHSKRFVNTTLVQLEEINGVARALQHYSMTTTADVSPKMPRKLQTLSNDTWLLTDGEWRLAKTQTFEMELISGDGTHRHLKAQASAAQPKRFPLFVNARMWEYIEPIGRGLRYEEPLDAFMIRNGLGEWNGGGTQMGDTPKIEYVDVSVWLRDSDEAISQIAQELGRLGSPIGSELHFTRGGQDVAVPFGSTECLAIFLDGVTLPPDVYKNNDVNVVLAKLNETIKRKGIGEFRAHWHGPRETALFFNGANAAAMKESMMATLTSEPLCQNARVIVRYGHHPSGAEETRLPLHA